jgi:kinesin family member C1
MSSMQSAQAMQAADSARVAAEMDAERAKVNELQQNQQNLSKELAAAKDHNMNQRRELCLASDQIAELKKAHALEVMDLEMSVKKKDRENRELTEDLRLVREDLERERQTVSTLKATIAQQSNAQLTLTTENQSLQAQNQSLRALSDATSVNVSDLTYKLEQAQKTIEDLREEVIEGETIRRKLHNTVQELKGNIRVFCRVRPLLQSDVSDLSSSGSSGSVLDLERAKEDHQAKYVFPDPRDHKEITVASSSESATGQERNVTHNFGFDRVSRSLDSISRN